MKYKIIATLLGIFLVFPYIALVVNRSPINQYYDFVWENTHGPGETRQIENIRTDAILIDNESDPIKFNDLREELALLCLDYAKQVSNDHYFLVDRSFMSETKQIIEECKRVIKEDVQEGQDPQVIERRVENVLDKIEYGSIYSVNIIDVVIAYRYYYVLLATTTVLVYILYKNSRSEERGSNKENTSKEKCCPKFDTKRWDKKAHEWNDKLFIQDDVRQLFHIPLNMQKVIGPMFEKIQEANAAPKDEDFLMLAYDPSPWKSEIYMTVTKPVPDAKMVKLSGTFISMVFAGPYSAVPKWAKRLEEYINSKGKTVKKFYFHFAYCPKCVEKYGKNYAIGFAEVE